MPRQKTELIKTTLGKLGYKEMKAQLRKLEDAAVSPGECTAGDKLTNIKEPSDTFFSRGGLRCDRGKGFRGSQGGQGN